MRNIVSRLVATMAFLLAMATGSFAADWVVAQMAGTVWLVAPDSSAEQASVGQVVQPGWTVGTGPDSRVLLVNGEESMSIGADTIMMFRSIGRSTIVMEQQGEITFEIDERNVRNFAVHTPLLAAVVKGTEFAVSVSPHSSMVGVNGGSVEVRSLGNGQTALIQPGQGAQVFADNPELVVFGAGVLPVVMQGRPGGLAPAIRSIGGVGDDDGDGNGHAYAFGPGNNNGNAYGQGNGNGNGNGNGQQ